jgi:hypothetical protein
VIVTRTALIAPPGGSRRLSQQLACDLLWLHVKPDHQVEHIRVQAEVEGFHIVWFMLGTDEPGARERARSICHDTISTTPALLDWRVA